MLPTQFIPEYYRDAKDILWAETPEEKRRPRRSPFTFVRRLIRSLAPKPKKAPAAPPVGRFSH